MNSKTFLFSWDGFTYYQDFQLFLWSYHLNLYWHWHPKTYVVIYLYIHNHTFPAQNRKRKRMSKWEKWSNKLNNNEKKKMQVNSFFVSVHKLHHVHKLIMLYKKIHILVDYYAIILALSLCFIFWKTKNWQLFWTFLS